MGFLSNVFKTTAGVLTGGLSGTLDEGLQGLANQAGDLFNRATGAAQANQWQWDMWNAQNAYNTPAAMRQRLIDAGYNPSLMYGNASSGGSAGAMTSKQGQGTSGLNPLDWFSVISTIQKQDAETRLAVANAEKAEYENTKLNPVTTPGDTSTVANLIRALIWANKNTDPTSVKNIGESVGTFVKGIHGAFSPVRSDGKSTTDISQSLQEMKAKAIKAMQHFDEIGKDRGKRPTFDWKRAREVFFGE
uniref:DNA pilot protein n=1 Tax=Dulem virus 96 TaxID=3145807 RepID=A0AAU8AUB7_9VIRU